MTTTPSPMCKELSWKQGMVYLAGAAMSFQLAYSVRGCGFLIAVYLWCLFELTRLRTSRQAFYFGLGAALLAYAPQSGFLWTIFGPAAIPLWCVLAFWVGLFVMLGRLARVNFGRIGGIVVIPFLWTGLEYFRSELYYLRFSWLNVGYVFSNNLTELPFHILGMYGTGFLLITVIAALALFTAKKSQFEISPPSPRPSPPVEGEPLGCCSTSRTSLDCNHHGAKRQIVAGALVLIALAGVTNLPDVKNPPSIAERADGVRVAGVQLEFPSELQVTMSLDKLIKKHPDAQLLVLSEYTFTGPVPEKVKSWCAKNHRYLVIGAKDPVSESDFYDTAFVIGPTGEIVFRQGKSVPIQFFKDGLPAKEQRLWESPWGKIGMCICYDLSYTRVTDRLIRLGAQAIVVPTMDVMEWGCHQHELHARVAPIRAAEYGVPIFRLASSGISQCVDAAGNVRAIAPMPGEEAMIFGTLRLEPHEHLPFDRYFAPVCVALTGFAIVALMVISFRRKKIQIPKPS